MLRKFTVPVTVDASGNATAYTPHLSGFIATIQYVKDDFADGVDFTITAEDTNEPIWVESNVNAAAIKHPQAASHTTAGVAALYAAGGTAVGVPIALSRDRVKIVVASGGNATSGTFVITVSD
ncbi:MAG TPA: hypothetical protein PKA33_01635 [Amaricoccus sp.]|uniref:hypothetical protein n=1 Tax=Amaricoccus sp. TaxID=1872485 RepID=UPI002BF926A5|nr:hypothetical protein [Amaricoccus sp.]HMR51203.1 hypothetical protein [Amaricoccus sp.]HMT98048.1 hypothetical protein [Amaricoccus sp.]